MKMSVHVKLFLSFGIVVFITLVVSGVLGLVFAANTNKKVVSQDLNQLAETALLLVKNNYVMSNTTKKKVQLYNADFLFNLLKGKITLDSKKTISLNVTNQVTNESKMIELPQMLYQGENVYKNSDLIDQLAKETGGTVTLFQMFNGGMVRLSTNLKNSDGSRAIATYIPSSSEVYQTVANGDTYNGRAAVFNDWYVTSYKPIKDEKGNVFGAVYTGEKEIDYDLMSTELLKIKLGKTGYFYIANSKGDIIIHPTLAGQNLYNTKDKYGYEFMKDICAKKNGVITYWWQNEGEKNYREKMVIYKYFQETDWIILGGIYTDELYEDINKFRDLFIIILIVTIISVATMVIFIANSIANPIVKMTREISLASNNLESASYQVSSSSQELSSGSSELASSIEEITSSLEELQSVIESNTNNINQSELMMSETKKGSVKATEKMSELQVALTEINENSKRIVKIIKVIDDIAFQTNILALNAAVEAARAGDAGKGFAVVADQVKSLAQKSAEAAKETAELIDKAINSVLKGEELGKNVNEIQTKATEMTEKVAVLLDEVNRASKEQLKGINQITQAVNQTNSVVQQTASSAEESAAASEELLSQAESLNTIVDKLFEVIKGNSKDKNLKETSGKTTKEVGEKKLIQDKTPKKLASNTKDVDLVRPEDKIPMNDFSDF